jgi:hypothetical protein
MCRRRDRVNDEFYDMKLKEKIIVTIISRTTYNNGGRLIYAFKAKTEDGRNLTKYVSQSDWDAADVLLEEQG